MENYRPAMSFDEDTARVYDDVQRGDEMAAVAFLEQLARGGPALELAIGTGRIALPLAARGIRMAGIDFSPPMVARLRAKPGGDQIAVTMGNFADVSVPGRYRLIYIVFNTLYNLLTQDEQVRCFENAAAHLTDDGSFVVEGTVPADLYRLRNNQYVDLEAVAVDTVRLDVAQHDPVKQLLVETHVTLSGAGLRLNPIVTRYVWPAELDLMARIAGLSLAERWGGWGREPFTATSGNCVSVYERRA
jgi:SAM-dependent methyltransferase